MRLKLVTLAVIAPLMTSGFVDAQIVNGEFSLGAMGWSSSGGIFAQDAFICQTGSDNPCSLSQDVDLSAEVDYRLVAFFVMRPESNNGDGGSIELSIDNDVLFTHAFGDTEIGSNEVAFADVNYTPAITSSYSLNLDFTRSFGTFAGSPRIYLHYITFNPPMIVPEQSLGVIALAIPALWRRLR